MNKKAKAAKSHTEARQEARPYIERTSPPKPAAPLLEPASQRSAAIDLPSDTVAVSLAGNGDLLVSQPNSPNLIIPLDLNGLRLLRNLLIVKKQAKKAELGTNAKPIQQMVDKFLKNRELEKAIEEEKQFETLKELF